MRTKIPHLVDPMTIRPRIRRFFEKHKGTRQGLRYVLTRFGVHRGRGKDDILLLSSPRAGSTWLMEVIASEPGMRFVNEPLRPEYVDKARLPTQLDELPPLERKILDMPYSAEKQLRSIFTDPRITRLFGPYDFFSPQFHWLTTRRIIKEVHSLGIADWIDHQDLGFKIVYLLRHPVSTALSMIRGCTLRAEANLRHQNFRERYLTKAQVELGWTVLHDGSEFEKRILEWCLENIVPWKIVTTRPHDWLVVTYEELVLSPDQSLRLIASRLGLQHLDRLRQAMTRPSASTHDSRLKLVRSSDPEFLVQEWRSSVSAEMEAQAHTIIQEFGISAYECGSYVARDEFLHFPETPRLKSSHWEPAPEDRLVSSSVLPN
jgi:hypothetical protein